MSDFSGQFHSLALTLILEFVMIHRMKKYSVSMGCVFLAMGGFLPAQEAPKMASNPYAITLDGAYGWPFGTTSFSGRKATGFDGGLSFEYRKSDSLSLGLGYDQATLVQDSLSASLGAADLFLRYMPFGRGSVEPYILCGAGGVVYSSTSDATYAKTRAYHVDCALGALYGITPNWAFDCALGYQTAGAAAQDFNFVNLRLGLQERFGAKTAPALSQEQIHANELEKQKLPEPSPLPPPASPKAKKGKSKSEKAPSAAAHQAKPLSPSASTNKN